MKRRTFKQVFYSGVLMGMPTAIILCFLGGNVLIEIACGLFSGILSCYLISIYMEGQKKKFKKIEYEVTKGKAIVLDGACNRLQGMVGGWLYLTEDELIFITGDNNIGIHDILVPLAEINDIHTEDTMGFIPNGFKIVTEKDLIEKFSVNNRRDWIAEISKRIFGSLTTEKGHEP